MKRPVAETSYMINPLAVIHSERQLNGRSIRLRPAATATMAIRLYWPNTAPRPCGGFWRRAALPTTAMRHQRLAAHGLTGALRLATYVEADIACKVELRLLLRNIDSSILIGALSSFASLAFLAFQDLADTWQSYSGLAPDALMIFAIFSISRRTKLANCSGVASRASMP